MVYERRGPVVRGPASKNLAVIADREFYARDPAAHLEKLKAVSEKITQLGAAIPRPIPGDFAHYLQRQSYQKALDWFVTNKA